MVAEVGGGDDSDAASERTSEAAGDLGESALHHAERVAMYLPTPKP